jgi:hypothetical protein
VYVKQDLLEEDISTVSENSREIESLSTSLQFVENMAFDHELKMLMEEEDESFENMLLNKSNWKSYTHPDGIYTLRYPANFEMSYVVEDSANDVHFESPFEPVEYTFSESENFRLEIYFYAGGGGNSCTGGGTDLLRELNLVPVKIHSFNDYIGSMECWKSGSEFAYFNLSFEPREKSKYIGVISAKYENLTQREVIKEIVELVTLFPDKYPSYE